MRWIHYVEHYDAARLFDLDSRTLGRSSGPTPGRIGVVAERSSARTIVCRTAQ